ncbi:hypothetical protein HHI36_006186 [Cryptolaemus montrouzieri]|uniref:Uncharacterized protein n=1 Tax=Cryptolaemus montrouzieri TaxID=559131 RepID=A0ABD2NWB5_9CUCU
MRQPSLIARPRNPQLNSNFLSILTFWYTLKVFNQSRRRNLDEDDLTQPLPEHQSEYLGKKLAMLWSEELESAKRKGKQPKMYKALCRCFLWDIVGYSITAFILEMFVRISQPLFLKLLLRYYSADNMKALESESVKKSHYTFLQRLFHLYDADQGPISREEAVFFTFGVIFSSWLAIAIGHPYLMGIMHLGMKMRVACCSLIYRKALSIRLELAGERMMGNVINLLSNDVNRFDNGIMFFPYIWLTPIQIALITYFLYKEVGSAAIYGILALISVLPLQFWLAFKMLALRYKTAIKTDERVREMNELIQSIQVVKMYTWEQVFSDIICKNRNDEVELLKRMGYIKGVFMSFLIFAFRFALFVMAISHIAISGEITAEKIFVLTAFLLILRQTVTVFFPQTLAQGAELLVSLFRVREFLFMKEAIVGDTSALKPKSLIDIDFVDLRDRSLTPIEGNLKISNASARFGDDVVLRNINLEVTPGLLTVVIGPVGCGKSCLLYMIIRELPEFEGNVDVRGVISYASQEPWLFSGTIRQNILFGRDFNKKRYQEVCFVCALNADFKLLPQGDKTMVGEKGSALSGGQRARVNLARAIYKEADIYILDDPLSAVDTRVGQHLFHECIIGYIADKIVLLVTHQLQYLEDADQIVLMKDGSIEAIGDYEFLKGAGLDFSSLITEQLIGSQSKTGRLTVSERKSTIQKVLLEVSGRSIGNVTFIDKDNLIPGSPRIPKEIKSSGRIKFSVYKEYFKASSNSIGIILMFALFILTQMFSSTGDFFLAKWIEMEEFQQMILSRKTCISIYTNFIFVTIILALIRSFHFFYLCMNASKNLHNNMFRSVVQTRMYFFHKNSAGTILNRFSKDLGSIDEILPIALIDTWQITLNLAGVIVVVGIINPYLLIPTFLMCWLFYHMRRFYLKTSSNIKRLESTSKSPVFAHLNSTLQGLPTIRSNRAEQLLTEEFDRHQDIHSSAWFLFISTSRALGYWLDNICVIFITVVAVSFLYTSSHDSQVGLAITQTLSLTLLVQWGLRQSAEVENQMVSVERVIEYTKLEPEPNLLSDPVRSPPPFWPTSGKIEFSHAFMKYGPQDSHVLNDVSFVIEDKEKVGIVGRTGAGKSSLIGAVFRLAYFYGEIRLDNLDISQLCLHDLRRKISIIPQEPVLFSGTLQYNLDPYNEYDDDIILKVLLDLEHKGALSSGKGCLQHIVVEGGANVSVGQKQIICLARALLRDNKVIVMDEATANIDARTDKFIQSVVRTKFANCTVITIAHRLHTIMDSNKVLVMDAGQVAEFDHPHILLQNPDGIFSTMVRRTGEHMADSLRNIAAETYKKQTSSK